MKIPINAFTALIVLLPLSAFAMAVADGLTVKRQVKEGQIYTLNLKASLEVAGQQASFTASDQSKITKVGTDGSYTIESQQIGAKANVGGQDIDVPDAPAVVTVYNADGSVKQLNGDDSTAGASAYRIANLQSMIDPGKPLNVGDVWSVDIKADSKTGAEAAKADFKILAEEKVDDVDTIKVQANIKETSGSDPAASEGTYWLEKANGSVVKAELKWTDVPIPGAPTPISGTVNLTRAK